MFNSYLMEKIYNRPEVAAVPVEYLSVVVFAVQSALNEVKEEAVYESIHELFE